MSAVLVQCRIPRHGTVSRYTSRAYACRCDLCREAWRVYMAELRATHRRIDRRAS